MVRFSLFLSAVLACAAVLMSSPPAEARPAEPRHIFERIFGPPVGSRTRRAYSVRRVRPASPRRAVAARPAEPSLRAGPVRRVRPDARPQRDLAARLATERAKRVEARPARIMPDAELVETIMTDPTLRRGDVVEFPDGPRVYRGNGRFSSHKFSDFDDVVPAERPVASAARPAAAGTRPDASAGVAGTERRQESAEAGRN